MIKQLTISSVYVLDQQQALDFYCGTLGMEVADDLQFGPMRWLTVRVPGDPTRSVLLELPAPPSMSEATAETVRELVSKGSAGGHLFFTTDDCRKPFPGLQAHGTGSVRCIRVDEVALAGIGWHAEAVGAETATVDDLLPPALEPPTPTTAGATS